MRGIISMVAAVVFSLSTPAYAQRLASINGTVTVYFSSAPDCSQAQIPISEFASIELPQDICHQIVDELKSKSGERLQKAFSVSLTVSNNNVIDVVPTSFRLLAEFTQ